MKEVSRILYISSFSHDDDGDNNGDEKVEEDSLMSKQIRKKNQKP
jgi:hypothetical protein